MTEKSILDQHGASWRQWILDNLERNCNPIGMLERMTKSVWNTDQAKAAIDQGLVELNKNLNWRKPIPSIPNSQLVALDQQTIRVLGRFNQPKAALLDAVLSQNECQKLIQYATSKGLKSSGVVDGETGQSIQHQARTSSTVFFTRAETPLIDRIEQRLARLTNWPVSHGEGLQILRYQEDQQYKPHFDWFDPNKPGSAKHLERGGQRVATTIMYLAAPTLGGATTFPKTGIEVQPNVGGAMFFNDIDDLGVPDQLSLHAGAPVIEGTKIIMTYWQREQAFRK